MRSGVLARCHEIVALRHHHEVGLPQSFHRTSPIGVLIASVEIMRIEGVVFGESVGGGLVDPGAERAVVERRSGSRDLPEGVVE